jgi:hypothetical protein
LPKKLEFTICNTFTYLHNYGDRTIIGFVGFVITY